MKLDGHGVADRVGEVHRMVHSGGHAGLHDGNAVGSQYFLGLRLCQQATAVLLHLADERRGAGRCIAICGDASVTHSHGCFIQGA